ncbi:hypothetical protein CMUS01_11447 [Colletotrichum musicola]|uniref:Uncharacterized protein n=1 Tax=Colletotrichum musicola TaxID=2175873 RepID=A0A8H6N678_9PEZI|nr:hypothetical protein CMUS01_11447 [Colletotrichum musicola]
MPGSRRRGATRDATRRGFPTRDAKTCQTASTRDTTEFMVGDKDTTESTVGDKDTTESTVGDKLAMHEDQLPETRLRAKARASDDKTGAAATQNEGEPFGRPFLDLSANFVFR